MVRFVWAGCYSSVAAPYSKPLLGNGRELLLVRDLPPHLFKHVVAGLAAPAILHRTQSFFRARVRQGLGVHPIVHNL